MPKQFDSEELTRKVEAREALSDAEEAYYLEHVLKFTSDQFTVENILAITSNTNENVIID